MGKFATDVLGNIDSGTEVLANNMVFLQQTKEQDISNLFGDLFLEGIININMGTAQNPKEPFKLTQGTVAGKFSVDIGVAYCQDSDGIYRRIAIENLVDYHNEIFGDTTYPDGMGINQKTFDGVDTYINTPKSSGCINVDIPGQGITYYVDLRYVNVCDNGNDGTGLNLTNYSIAKNLVPSSEQRKRFYKWVDGYNIALITDLSEKQGIILGTVQNNSGTITTTLNGRSSNLLINSKVFLDYFSSGQGMVLSEQDGKTVLSVNTDNVTVGIEDNKVRVTKDGLYTFTRFALNSGPNKFLNDYASGDNNIYLSSAAITTPVWVNPTYNDRYSVTSLNPINVQTALQEIYGSGATLNGVYTLCINNTDKNNNNVPLDNPKFEIMENVYVGINQPDGAMVRIWLDTKFQPFQAKWYNGTDWVEYHGVPVAYIRVASSSLTEIAPFDYNKDYSKWNELGRLVPYSYNLSSVLGNIPEKHLIADGSSGVSIINYYDLYMKMTNYGTQVYPYGNNTVSFTLPDTMGKVLWGGDSIGYIAAGLPNITGNTMVAATRDNLTTVRQYVTGSFYGEYDIGESVSVLRWTSADNDTHNYIVSFDASRSNSIYNNSATVQPPSLQVPMLIKALL